MILYEVKDVTGRLIAPSETFSYLAKSTPQTWRRKLNGTSNFRKST